MSEKASGNGKRKDSSDDPLSGEKVGPVDGDSSLDPDFAEKLDPVDQWWADEKEEDSQARPNRKLDPFESRKAKQVSKPQEEPAEEPKPVGVGEAKLQTSPPEIPPLTRSSVEKKAELSDEVPETTGEDENIFSSPATEEQENTDVAVPFTKEVESDPSEVGKKSILTLPSLPEDSDGIEEDAPSPAVKESDQPKAGKKKTIIVVPPESVEADEIEDAENSEEKEKEPEIGSSEEEEASEKGGDSDSNDEEDDSDDEEDEDDDSDDEHADSDDEDDDSDDEGDDSDDEGDDSDDEGDDSDDEGDDSDDEGDDSDDEDDGSDDLLPAVSDDLAPAKRKAGCWTVFATLFFFATLLVVIALAVAAFIGWTKMKDLEAEISSLATEKLEDQGIYLDYEGWHYQFPRGLILKNITVFETENREIAKIKASDMGVNVDFLGLIKDRAEATAAEVSFDDTVFTFFHEGESVGTLEDVDGEIFASREQIRIERFHADLGGLQVAVSGAIALPKEGESGAEVDSSDGEGTEEPSPSALLSDFSALKRIQPYLEIESAGKPPVLDLKLDFDSSNPEVMNLSANLNGRDFTWRGVPITTVSLLADFDPETKEVNISSFQLGYGDGMIGGVFTLDTQSKLLTIIQAQSTVDVIALLSDFNSDIKEKVKDLRLVDSPTIQLSGVIPLDAPAERAKLDAVYEHRGGLVYTGGDRELPISDLRGKVVYDGGAIETDDFAALLLGGDVRINGIVRVTAKSTPFSGLVEISRLQLSELANYFGKPDLGMTGNLYLDFHGVGYSEMDKIRGGGKLRINEAKLPSFPAIGAVQEFLGKVIPAFGIQGEGSVTGAYIIESGIFVTNDLTVEQSGAKLVTNGSVKLKYLSTDFTTTASLQDTLATATGLGGKSIIVVGEGDLMKPTLKLKEFPLDFAAGKLSEVLGTTPETLGLLQSVIGEDEGAAVSVFGQELEEVTGLDLGEEINGLLKGIFEAGAEEAGPVAEPVGEN